MGPLRLSGLIVPLSGAVQATEDPFEPFRLVDSAGDPVVPVMEFLADLQAAGRAEATQRSYTMALLRWFRFLWTVGVPWDQATRVEARDFIRWVQVASKPERRHWRKAVNEDAASARPGIAVPNRVTGKSRPARSMPRRPSLTARRSRGRFTTSACRPGRGRWSIPSRWPGPGGRMLTTIRWTGSPGSGPGCSGRGWRSGSRGRSRMARSMSCSPP